VLNFSLNKKGIILYLVLGTIMIVVVLANIVLTVILSQSRLTHHQVSRIQAYYAGLAGMNYAFEQLRLGNWQTGTYELNDSSFPPIIRRQPLRISISNPNSQGIRTINITVNYTYTP